jgi:iron(III) transport system permease protein
VLDVATIVYLAAFLVVPLAVIVAESARVALTGGLGELPGFPRYLSRLTRNSILLAVSVTAVSVGLGLLLAIFTGRVIRRKTGFMLALTLPLLAPPFVSAFATIILLGRVGVLTQLLERAGIRLFDIYGFPGIAITHVLHLTPLAYLTILAGLRTVPKAIEESAVSLGSSPAQVITRIVLPYIGSHIYMAALLVFLASFGDVGAPLIVGGNYLVLPTEAYTRFLSFTVDRQVPVLLSGWIVVLSGVILVAVRALMRRTQIVHTFVVEQYAYDVPWMRRVGTAFCATVAAALLLPYAVILAMSLATAWGPQLLPKGWTLLHYRELWRSVGPMRNTLVVTAMATPVAVLLAVVIGRVMREGGRQAAVLDYTTLLPFVVSGVVLGIGMVKVYSSLAAAGVMSFLMLGPNLLVIALVVRRVPYPARVMNAAYTRIDRSLEESSFSLGASPARTFASVTLPQLYPGIAAALTITFIQVISELGTTLIVHRPEWRTISVQIYSYAIEGYLGRASALSVVLLVLVGLAVLLTQLDYRRLARRGLRQR